MLCHLRRSASLAVLWSAILGERRTNRATTPVAWSRAGRTPLTAPSATLPAPKLRARMSRRTLRTTAVVGLALSLVFVGGALRKAACDWLGARFGVPLTVIATERGNGRGDPGRRRAAARAGFGAAARAGRPAERDVLGALQHHAGVRARRADRAGLRAVLALCEPVRLGGGPRQPRPAGYDCPATSEPPWRPHRRQASQGSQWN